jgi:hypothetical protein
MGYGRLAREFSQRPPAILQTNYVIKLRHPATEKRNPTPHIPCPGKTALDRRLANNDPGRPYHGFRLSERLCLLFGQAASLCGAPDDGDPVSAHSAALRRRLAQAARQREGHRFACASSATRVRSRSAAPRAPRRRSTKASGALERVPVDILCGGDELRAASLALDHFAQPLRIGGIDRADDDHRHDLPRRGLDRLLAVGGRIGDVSKSALMHLPTCQVRLRRQRRAPARPRSVDFGVGRTRQR